MRSILGVLLWRVARGWGRGVLEQEEATRLEGGGG